MKQFLWSVGLFIHDLPHRPCSKFFTHAGPAAMLGIPRVSLGIPRPSADAPAPIRQANHTESEPIAMPPDLDPPGVPLTPYHQASTVQQTPKAPAIEEGTGVPKHGPSGHRRAGRAADRRRRGAAIRRCPSATPSSPRSDRIAVQRGISRVVDEGLSTPPLLTTGPAASNGILGSPGSQSPVRQPDGDPRLRERRPLRRRLVVRAMRPLGDRYPYFLPGADRNYRELHLFGRPAAGSAVL